jgi:hypothetical protein
MGESRPPLPSTRVSNRDGRALLAWSVLALALLGGGVLRLLWIEDMEWKKDERWSYQMSQEVGRSLPWPAVGMPTSLGFPNPGLSVWIFVPIGRIAVTPTAMARVIVFLNMIGLLGFGVAVRACLPSSDREPWIWGLSLQAVSPFAIRMSRKIWPPSILTPLLLSLWISHRYRLSRSGAFAWGMMGALIGQVHLSGWFVAAGLAAGTAVGEWRSRLPRSRFWYWWLLGTVLGLLTALPWARALPSSSLALAGGPAQSTVSGHVVGYLHGLVATTTSLLPFAALGLGHETPDYLVGPILSGIPLHVPDLLSWLTIVAIAARIAARLLGAIIVPSVRWARRSLARGVDGRRNGDPRPSSEPAQAAAESASTGFYLWSTLALPSAVFMLTTGVYFYHYYFVLCPFLFVLVAACMLPWRRLLLGLVIAQALIAYAFVSYIHEHGGAHRGEYGVSYGRQVNHAR